MRLATFLILLQAFTPSLFGFCDFEESAGDFRITKTLSNTLLYKLSAQDEKGCEKPMVAICQCGHNSYPVISLLDADARPYVSLSRSLVSSDHNIQLFSGSQERGLVYDRDANETSYWYTMLEDPGILRYFKMQFFIPGLATNWVVFNGDWNASLITIRDSKSLEPRVWIESTQHRASTSSLRMRTTLTQNLTNLYPTFILLAASVLVDRDFNVSARCQKSNVFPDETLRDSGKWSYLMSGLATDRFQQMDQGMLIVVLAGSLVATLWLCISHPACIYR